MKKMTLGLLVCAFAIAWGSSTQADFVLSFDSSSYTIVDVNDTVQVLVFLEQNNSTETLSLDGLSFAKFRIDYGTSTPSANVANLGAIVANPGFDDFVDLALEPNGITFDAASLTSIFPDVSDPNRILLGSFTFTGLSPGATTLTFSDFPENDSFLSGLIDPLDAQISFGASASISFTAVPEPSSLLFAGVMSLSGLAFRFRRKKVFPLLHQRNS